MLVVENFVHSFACEAFRLGAWPRSRLELHSSLNYNAAALMNVNNGLVLVPPRVTPVLDPWFRPAVLANRVFRQQARTNGKPVPVRLALEQADGSVAAGEAVLAVWPSPHEHDQPDRDV